jgi:glycosyltransferase involved in cell wall biosynthesis
LGRSVTSTELAEQLRRLTVENLEALERHHFPAWQLPRVFAGHAVGADVRADLCFTLAHLADAGVTSVAGEHPDAITARLLREVDGRSTHTFFSYRIAETLARHGAFAGNPLLAECTDAERAEVALATDSSDWLELLDTELLPRNYAAVLARCALAREQLALDDDPARLDSLVTRTVAVLGENPRRFLDDSNHRVGRYDIYTADVWLFCEPLADRLGPLWEAGLRTALDLVLAVGSRDGTAVPWGRSTGALGAALTVELGAFAIAEGYAEDVEAVWLRRAMDATRTLTTTFDPDGVSNAHRHRDQDEYRGPARRLQLTLDLLGKIAFAAAALRPVPPGVVAASPVDAYAYDDRWIGFEEHRAAGVWAHRSAGADFVLPLVGASRSHYLPAPYQPGTWEVPVDQDLPCWTPLVISGLGRYTAAGVPAALRHEDGVLSVHWETLAPSGVSLDAAKEGTPLAATRNLRMTVERRSLVLDDQLTFAEVPDAVSLAIPEVAGRPVHVEWSCATPHTTTRITVGGLAEWRSPWSEIDVVHQLDCAPSEHLVYGARVTPLLRVGSTAYGHHYDEALYAPMADRVVERPPPIGWQAPADATIGEIDLLHMHWPEWVAFDDLAAHEAILGDLREHGVPVVWTAHNLTPHEQRPEIYEAIYAAWARQAAGVIHHSEYGKARMLARYEFAATCRHEVIAHGHFGGMWTAAGLPDRATAQARLGLAPAAIRIGLVGAPRADKLVQVFLEAVAACGRDDVQVVCWSLGPGDVVPDDPRIAIAQQYRGCDAPTYASRLAACDALALVFDPDGDMLATGTVADAQGVGLPALVSEWGYLTETLGEGGIPVGHTVASIAAALDALTVDRLAIAAAAVWAGRDAYEWAPLANRTADLFERALLQEP